VPTPGTNAKRAFFGALDAVTGTFHTADHDRQLAPHVVAFLQRLADAYPDGPRVTVLWLPRYAAHTATPVERIWGLMTGDIAANRLTGRITELPLAARRFFAHRAPHPPYQSRSWTLTETVPNFRRRA
jgi:hypothetical protein